MKRSQIIPKVILGLVLFAVPAVPSVLAQENLPLSEELVSPGPEATPQAFIPIPTIVHAAPLSKSDCPADFPIKGNRNSMIYHTPGGQFYARTDPEDCYATGEAAAADGFRASQR